MRLKRKYDQAGDNLNKCNKRRRQYYWMGILTKIENYILRNN
jgi:hypothetical protein